MHLDLHHTVALTGLAASAFNIEAEAAGLIAPRARLLGAGEELAHRGKDAGVGCRVGARSAPDWTLIDIDNLIEQLHAFYVVVFSGGEGGCAIKFARRNGVKRIVD